LYELDKFSEDNGSATGNNTDGAGQEYKRKGLDLVELFAKTLTGGFPRGRRNSYLPFNGDCSLVVYQMCYSEP
jgi:hypothetical protein